MLLSVLVQQARKFLLLYNELKGKNVLQLSMQSGIYPSSFTDARFEQRLVF